MTDNRITISKISALSGIDRRTGQRALLDLDPETVETDERGRKTAYYDACKAVAALLAAGVDPDRALRVGPMGTSITRAAAWNVALDVCAVQWAAFTRLAAEHKVDDVTALRFMQAAAEAFDYCLANFGDRHDELVETDEALGFRQGRDPARGEFAAAFRSEDLEVRRLAQRIAKRKAALPRARRR